ncbi:MAG: MBL fold metallo-hydrolase, partial [Lachnospiraceae bacterium]|nr:MBL fold metallo-hydrolase [Lachnospiraceae bacterium]
MKATVLVDNIPLRDVPGEWGLCIYIEYQGKKILLDTGGSELFVKNATKLNKELQEVDYAVLSHAHYDHAGGMRAFFQNNQRAAFYLQKGSEENCYMKKWIFHKYIGLPRGILEEYRDRIIFAEGDYSLCQGVSLIPHKTAGLSEIGRRNCM